MAGGEVLGWGEHGEGLVGADGVVGAFPVAGGAGEARDGEGFEGEVVALLAAGTVEALDPAVELGAVGRVDEEEEATVTAGSLEVGHELRATVDLDGADREGHAHQCIEGTHGERGGGVGGDGGSGKAADHVHGAELLHEITPKAQVDGIDLDEVAGAQGDVARGLARGMRAEPASTLGGGTVEARLLELPAPLEVAQDAANARKGELEAQSTQEHLELELAPAHVLFALLTDGHDLRRRPRPSPRPTGAAGPVFERG